MNRGSLHTRSFSCIHFSILIYRWTKNSFTGRKVSQAFEKRAPGLWIPESNTRKFITCNNSFYYISKLVRALGLVILAGRTLLHGPLKYLKFFCCQTIAWFITKSSQLYEANNSLKLSFTLNYVLKRANDLKTISNWLVLLSTWFRNLKPFLMNGNRSRTRQTHKEI